MCGISGFYSFRSGAGFPSLQAANDRMMKRGPDSGAVYQDECVGLGHRRLSIIDVSSAGNQPMKSPDGRYVMVFNGEIFNYRELRQQYLSDEDVRRLASTSDTE